MIHVTNKYFLLFDTSKKMIRTHVMIFVCRFLPVERCPLTSKKIFEKSPKSNTICMYAKMCEVRERPFKQWYGRFILNGVYVLFSRFSNVTFKSFMNFGFVDENRAPIQIRNWASRAIYRTMNWIDFFFVSNIMMLDSLKVLSCFRRSWNDANEALEPSNRAYLMSSLCSKLIITQLYHVM